MSFHTLEKDLALANMHISVSKYLRLCIVPAAIFAINIALLSFFILGGTGMQWISIPLFVLSFGGFMVLLALLPSFRAKRIGQQIEADIFVPSRMLLTLLESGNSLVKAFDRVSRTNTMSGKYFGKIAAEVYLGKNIDKAIDDAIRNTPGPSFRRVLEPLKNSIRTGASIEKNLASTLDDLTQEKLVEIERYEKRLGPMSMFYMIFGAIMPPVGVIMFTILLSVIGIKVTFFPFFLIFLMLTIIVQFFFWQAFKSIRPLVKL